MLYAFIKSLSCLSLLLPFILSVLIAITPILMSILRESASTLFPPVRAWVAWGSAIHTASSSWFMSIMSRTCKSLTCTLKSLSFSIFTLSAMRSESMSVTENRVIATILSSSCFSCLMREYLLVISCQWLSVAPT